MKNILKRNNLLIPFLLLTMFSCKVYTGVSIYKSGSKSTYWTIYSLNVDAGKYTQLYISHYENNKIDFRIFYIDSFVRKVVYSPPKYSQYKNVKVYLTTDKDSFLLPLDSIDRQIFSTISTLNKTDSNIKFKMREKVIKGFILDPKYQHKTR